MAITWFFDHVEEGIILDDDYLPSPEFLPFCQSLLELYRTDNRIWCISGNNFQGGGQRRGDGSYYFSHYVSCWGVGFLETVLDKLRPRFERLALAQGIRPTGGHV